MRGLKIEKDGFVRGFAVAGPKTRDFFSDERCGNQLELEGILREKCAKKKPETVSENVKLGRTSLIGMPFRIAGGMGDFLDVSEFYSTMKTVEVEAAVTLFTEEEQTVTLQLWTYLAAALYVNGTKVLETKRPVYKPILREEAEVRLRAGENQVILLGDTLGVRDTRTVFGLRVKASEKPVTSMFPDSSCREQVERDIMSLGDIRLSGDTLQLPQDADALTLHLATSKNGDFEAEPLDKTRSVSGGKAIRIPEGYRTFRVSADRPQYTLSRSFAIPERVSPVYSRKKTKEELFRAIAGCKSADRGHFGFSVVNILARKALGIEDPEDHRRILEDFDLIEKRVDCSDFLVTGYLRYRKFYGFTDEEEKRFKEVMLGFRYWMNMKGSDGMCFWSENHSLMFYSAAMFIGGIYPDDWFPRAQRNGRQLSGYGKNKVLQWLDDVERGGFEEFLSTVYMPVTLAALLNLVDLAEEDIGRRAAAICDRMLREIAIQGFQGVEIAPMGRVYAGAISPFRGGCQCIMYLIDQNYPFETSEGWMSFLLTSRYKMPEDLKDLTAHSVDTEYSSGNAQIRLCKKKDYILTSVQSPRTDGKQRWKNILHDPDADTDTHEFNRSLNETFHGTSFFEPGTFGYQQHLFYAALTPEAVCFVNHPGIDSEVSDMRPGYWFGSGLMPALRQEGRTLGAIWRLNDTQPLGFTHLYFPRCKFDEVRESGSFLFARKGTGYLAIWHSDPLLAYNGGSMTNVEMRCYSTDHAWVFLAGDEDEYGDFQTFVRKAEEREPLYDRASGTLTAGDFRLTYTAGQDETQIVP
ncbi:MAG: hypothetical protein ACOX78_10460 [Lachnospiraceae bacterium]